MLVKSALIGFINSLIVFSLIILPMNLSSTAYAQSNPDFDSSDVLGMDETTSNSSSEVFTEQDCTEENKDSEECQGVYKPGEEFNDARSESDLEDHYAEGDKGILEQYIGAAFAMIGVSLFGNTNQQAAQSCQLKEATGARVTFPIVQAGSLAYLIGEVSANLEFKEAAQLAVDHTFQAKKDEDIGDSEASTEREKKNRESNDEQIKAYNALIEIYEKQSEGMEKKIKMATLAEAAFLTATGIEIADMLKLKSYCKSQMTGLNSTLSAELGSLQGMIATIETEGSGYAAICSESGSKCTEAGLCFGAALATEEYLIEIKADDAAINKFSLSEIGRLSKVMVKKIGNLGLFIVMIPVNAIKGVYDKVVGMFSDPKEEKTEDKTTGSENTSTAQARIGVRTGITTPIDKAASGGCTSATGAMGYIKSIETLRSTQVQCCGAITIDAAIYENIGSLNDDDKVADVITTPSSSGTTSKYLPHVTHNLIRAIALKRIETKGNDYRSNVEKIAKAEEVANYVVNNISSFIDTKEFKSELAMYRQKYLKSDQDPQIIYKIFKKLRSELLISNSYAESKTKKVWDELLNIGQKAVTLYMVMKDLFHSHAFPRPKTRAWTWGTMAALNAVILKFDKDTKDEIDDRAKITRQEKNNFIASNPVETKVEVIEPFDAGSSKITSEQFQETSRGTETPQASESTPTQYSTTDICAQGSGSDAAPVTCSSESNKPVVDLNPSADIEGVSTIDTSGILPQAINVVESGVNDAATGGASSAAVDGDVQNASQLIPRLVALNEGLLDKFDKQEKERFSTLKSKPASLKDSIAQARALFKATPVTKEQMNTGGGANFKAQLAALKADDLKRKKKTANFNFKAPKFSLPSFSSPNTSTTSNRKQYKVPTNKAERLTNEQRLAKFKVNAGEINDSKSTSLFVLISNRYLKNYSTFFSKKQKVDKKTLESRKLAK